MTHSNKHIRFEYFNLEFFRPLLSTNTYFSLYLLAYNVYYFTVNTASNIRPLRAVFVISLFLILVLTACIETLRKGGWLLSCFAILATIFFPCTISLWDPPKVRSSHGREIGWRWRFETVFIGEEVWGHHNAKQLFDEACRGEEGLGQQNKGNFFTKPVEERKDKYTMGQSNFLRNYADVQAEDREF